MKLKSILFILLGISMLTSCANGNRNQGQPLDTTHGHAIGLVWLWTVDNDGPEAGSATFELYKDNGIYYVKFYGRYYQLSRIKPYNAGRYTLTHAFTTIEGYQYYLEDVTDDDTWCFDLR